jgi:hypothetical protein
VADFRRRRPIVERMERFTHGLCALLACTVLWVSQPAVAAAARGARAEVSWVAGTQASAARVRARSHETPEPTAPRALPNPRLLRAQSEREAALGRCRRQAAAPPCCERIYLKHCVLQR